MKYMTGYQGIGRRHESVQVFLSIYGKLKKLKKTGYGVDPDGRGN